MSGAAEVTVRGTVQGAGFRPFVYRLASGVDLAGDVRNDGGVVVIRVSGSDSALADFLVRLRGFENRRLTEGVLGRLLAAGLNGFVGERVPVNDGGISYGQAVVAAARMGGE